MDSAVNRKTLTILSFVLSMTAHGLGLPELHLATSDSSVLDFWPGLNASCQMKFLQDNVCCAGSSFRDGSQAQELLVQALQRLPLSNVDDRSQENQKLVYESDAGLQVATEYFCDVPMAPERVPGRSCRKCLLGIVGHVLAGLERSESQGICRNAWGLRFGFIFEPDSPWEEDTTWCHLDYWFRVFPSSNSPMRHSNSKQFVSRLLTLARDLLWRTQGNVDLFQFL